MKFSYTIIFLMLSSISAAAATASVDLNVAITFEARKVVHSCSQPELSTPGQCGIYTDIELGETVAGFYTLSGRFDIRQDGFFASEGQNRLTSETCRIGSVRCANVGFDLSIHFLSSDVASLNPQGQNTNSFFNFNFVTGTGSHRFTDGNTIYSSVRFELSNAKIFGLPDVPVSEVPLPASLPLLALGIGGIGFLRKRAIS